MVSHRVACVSDLKPGDWVAVKCSCGHETYLPPYALIDGLQMQPQDRLSDLASRLRCGGCHGTGVAAVSVLWAAAA
jgi:hypothetical protein